ncbi:hypothetical protein TRVA0_046S00364 [Trichomonascus vanleenenianus]|uniref:uncharacterized protein n=1 Tax=Trichomonascus vanleenenianus TaxID=2268995 RepID=UPI003ECBA211
MQWCTYFYCTVPTVSNCLSRGTTINLFCLPFGNVTMRVCGPQQSFSPLLYLIDMGIHDRGPQLGVASDVHPPMLE